MLAHGAIGSLDELLIIGLPIAALVLFDRAVRKRRREAALIMLKQAKDGGATSAPTGTGQSGPNEVSQALDTASATSTNASGDVSSAASDRPDRPGRPDRPDDSDHDDAAGRSDTPGRPHGTNGEQHGRDGGQPTESGDAEN
ncbi:MAG: hypothetical protein H6512_12600 [Acidimicrobiia bacterium]|nr:hypothetical protein [Acidimicrobiia bacterium]